jgi:hypothetical protein
MVHEGLQADIVGEDGLCGLRNTAIGTSGVCGRWIQFRQQETSLRTAGIANDKSRQWEAVLDEFLKDESAN